MKKTLINTPIWKKLIYFLCLYIIFSSIFIIVYIAFQINELYESKSIQIAERAQTFKDLLDDDYSEVDAKSIVAGLYYNVVSYDNIDGISEYYRVTLRENEINALEKEEIIIIRRRHMSKIIPISLIKINDRYYGFSEIKQMTPILIIAQEKNIAVYYLTIILALGVIIYFITITQKPIEKLAEGLNEIARGNYDVEIIDNRQRDKSTRDAIDNFNNLAIELKKNTLETQNIITAVTHELKTPISIIKGYSQLLLTKSLSKKETEEYLNLINNECTRLSEFTSNIIYNSILKDKKFMQKSKGVRIDELIRKALLLYRKKYELKNITLKIDIREIKATTNEQLLYHAITNVIDNAIKYTPDGGILQIDLYKNKGIVNIDISDTGIGIPKDEIDKIFDQFYIASNNSNRNSSGIGLNLVKSIMNLLSGEIKITSILGKGTKISILL